MKVFVLRIRMSGEEDTVFLFDTEEKARNHCVLFFQEYGYTETLEEIWELGYGYYTLTEQEIN